MNAYDAEVDQFAKQIDIILVLLYSEGHDAIEGCWQAEQVQFKEVLQDFSRCALAIIFVFENLHSVNIMMSHAFDKTSETDVSNSHYGGE